MVYEFTLRTCSKDCHMLIHKQLRKIFKNRHGKKYEFRSGRFSEFKNDQNRIEDQNKTFSHHDIIVFFKLLSFVVFYCGPIEMASNAK